MPSWKIHEEWAVRFGVSREIARKVNILIDMPERILGYKDPFVGLTHDMRRDTLHGFKMGLYLAAKFYGKEGVCAYCLHQIMDYLETWIRTRSQQLAFSEASKRFRGISRVQRKKLMSAALRGRRYRRRELTGSDIKELKERLIEWCSKREVPSEVLRFILDNFTELLNDITSDTSILTT